MRAALASAREAQLSLQSSGRPHGAAAPPARRRLAAAAASTAERLHEHGGRPHHISSAGSSAAPRRTYPYIDRQFPRLELVHSEPPVYVVHDFASAADCELLRRQAEAGQLQRLEYDNKVLVDTHRLWPLALVVAAGAAFDCFQAASAAGAADALPAALGPALLRWMGITGGLLGAVMAAMNWMVGGRVFTGIKWTASGIDPAHAAAPACARFLARTATLLGAPASRLEAPTVTRYRRGERQRIHFDARPDGDPAGLQQFLEAGGQRLVQIVVYLNSMQPKQGGGTHFFNPLLKGLTVQPRQGDALVFFPAFADGRFDERMAHEGQPVLEGEKWILNTWCCQQDVPTAVTHLPLHQAESNQ